MKALLLVLQKSTCRGQLAKTTHAAFHEKEECHRGGTKADPRAMHD